MQIQRARRRSGCGFMTLFSGMVFGIVLALLAWMSNTLDSLQPHDMTRNLNSAQRAFDAGELDAAIETAQAVWGANPDRLDALSLLVRGLIYRSYHDYMYSPDRRTALHLTTEAYRHQHDDHTVKTLHALALYVNGEYVEAARLTTSVVNRSQTEQPLARVILGLAYGGMGNYYNALRQVQAVVSADIWQLDIQRSLALTFSDLGRYDDAVIAVEKAIQHNDRLMALYFERAEYAIHLGDTDAATAAYFRVLAFDPGNVKARLRLCELSSRLRESEQALQYCGEVVERAPDWSEGWYFLGREYFLRGDFLLAQQNLSQCASLSRSLPITERRFDCWYLQGQAAEILGDCPALTSIYNEYLSMKNQATLPQTWTYPPEGPPICTD